LQRIRAGWVFCKRQLSRLLPAVLVSTQPLLVALGIFDNLAVALTLSSASWESISGLLAVRFALQCK
jgi:hypothetical protein